MSIGLATLSGYQFHHYTNKNSGPVIKKTLSSKEFNSLKATTDIVDIELHVSDKYKTIYHGLKRFKPSVAVKNGQLEINQANKGGSYSITANNKVIIYLPAKELQKINIDPADGDINFNGKIQAKNVKIHSDDGDLSAKYLQADTAKLTSDDGDVSISNLLTKKGATVHSDDGNIRIKHSNAKGYRLTSDDGDVTFNGNTYDNADGDSYYKNTKTTNLLSAHSDDGDININ